MRTIVTVLGKDKQGIIHNVTGIVSGYGANILDISQTIMSENIFAMFMLIDTEHITGEYRQLAEDLQKHGEENGYTIHVQREDVFNAMHRI